MNEAADLIDVARRGKIARLPLEIRDEVNARLQAGQTGRVLLKWLNALPAVQAMLALEFSSEPVNDSNLSAWRQGGYAHWQARRERLTNLHELAKIANQYAQAAGGKLTEGAQAIVSGELLTILETVTDSGGKLDAEALTTIAGALTNLRTSEQNEVKLTQNDKRLAQKDEEIALARERARRETCELFLQWYADKRASEVADADASHADKIEKLGQLMYGDTWRPTPPAAGQ